MSLFVALGIFGMVYLFLYFIPAIVIVSILEYFLDRTPGIVSLFYIMLIVCAFYLSGIRSWYAANTYVDKLSFMEAHNDSGDQLRNHLSTLPVILRTHLSFLPIIGKLFQRKDGD
jgi:hypothetical protein